MAKSPVQLVLECKVRPMAPSIEICIPIEIGRELIVSLTPRNVVVSIGELAWKQL